MEAKLNELMMISTPMEQVAVTVLCWKKHTYCLYRLRNMT